MNKVALLPNSIEGKVETILGNQTTLDFDYVPWDSLEEVHRAGEANQVCKYVVAKVKNDGGGRPTFQMWLVDTKEEKVEYLDLGIPDYNDPEIDKVELQFDNEGNLIKVNFLIFDNIFSVDVSI